jgi:hypothetical protein
MAHSIMQNHHAIDINARGAEWRRSGWSGFDHDAAPYDASTRR